MRRAIFLTIILGLILALVSCQAKAAPTPAPTKPAAVQPTAPAAAAATPTPVAAKPAAATPTPVAAKPAATPLPAPVKKYEYLMGSTSTISSHYPPAIAIAKSVNDNVPGVHITVVETGATHDNLLRTMKGDLDIAFITNLEGACMAYQGTMRYTKPWPELRWWLSYIRTAMYNIVRVDSGIKSLNELTGRKFSAGIAGSAAEFNTRTILEALGIKPDWFIGSPADAVEAIKDRRAVGYAKSPASTFSLDSSTLDIQTFTAVAVLGFSEEQIKIALKAVPGLVRVDVAAGAIKQLPNFPALTSFGNVTGGFLTTKVPEDIGYRMTKAVVENWERNMVAAFPPGKDYDPVKDTIDHLAQAPNPPPLHAGTVRYFEERGAKIPAPLIPPEYKK